MVRCAAKFAASSCLWLGVASVAAFAQPRLHVPGRILVGFRESVSERAAEDIVHGNQGKSQGKIPGTNTHKVDLNAAVSEVTLLRAFERRQEVEYVEFDEIVEPSAITPNDPGYALQAYYPQINAPAGWSMGTGSVGVIIAIIDTGVNVNHPDLAGKIVLPHNMLNSGTDVSDNYNHGTVTAGVAAANANNGVGVASTCWQCSIMPVKVSDGAATISNIASALDWARLHGARVANISFDVSTSKTVLKIAQNFAAMGGVTTIAAGNGGKLVTSAESPYVLTVGAIDANNNRYGWSNYGTNLDLVAPGCVYSPDASGGYRSGCGTSFSAPITAGVAGLVIAMKPTLSAAQVMGILKQSAVDLGSSGWDPTFGSGRIDIEAALRLAAK